MLTMNQSACCVSLFLEYIYACGNILNYSFDSGFANFSVSSEELLSLVYTGHLNSNNNNNNNNNKDRQWGHSKGLRSPPNNMFSSNIHFRIPKSRQSANNTAMAKTKCINGYQLHSRTDKPFGPDIHCAN